MNVKIEVIILLICCYIWGALCVNCTEKGAGRFADPTDTTCKLYDLCVFIASDSSYQSYNFTCPEKTLFDPANAVCSNKYKCDSTNDDPPASCNKVGRIADPLDITCQRYFLCIRASDGSIVPYPYTCPPFSVFNPNSGICTSSSNYQCLL
ncbi:uncharacterized protein LOC123711975 [Pieris brassicae]|uniref:Chitin-binding type-2 domain-containing protein n=1 Tax=Pieris brassicae TaxID=7116 RepID=A0A9P0T7V7_PIEBR|nr:uncharacterized protein LOC123711975 [Pieris brassicae]CAH3993123.1 unnamed protein product [Pieris brassicae]